MGGIAVREGPIQLRKFAGKLREIAKGWEIAKNCGPQSPPPTAWGHARPPPAVVRVECRPRADIVRSYAAEGGPGLREAAGTEHRERGSEAQRGRGDRTRHRGTWSSGREGAEDPDTGGGGDLEWRNSVTTWHQFLNTTANFGTKCPHHGTRTSVHTKFSQGNCGLRIEPGTSSATRQSFNNSTTTRAYRGEGGGGRWHKANFAEGHFADFVWYPRQSPQCVREIRGSP